MDKFAEWFAKSPVASWLRAFAACLILAAVVSLEQKGLPGALADWQTWVTAALVASLPTLARIINPADTLSLPVRGGDGGVATGLVVSVMVGAGLAVLAAVALVAALS
jgi:hypothetical protein